MCTYAINKQFNGIEITFEEKPSAAIRTEMKDAGFRWHGVKKLWYAKKSETRLALAIRLSGDTNETPAPAQAAAPATTAEPVSRYGIKVGDILNGSFGYSMTLVEFYKVTKILSACRVEIVKIGANCVDSDRGGGERLVPDPENEIDEPIKKTVVKNRYSGGWYIKTNYCNVSPWSGSPVYQNSWD